MSDYEGDWDNEWEPVKSQINGAISSIPPEPLLNYVGYKGSAVQSIQQVAREKARKTRVPSVTIPPSYRPVLQKLRPGSIQTGHAYNQTRKQQEQKHIQQQAIELDAFKAYRERPQNPDGMYQMMHSFKEIVRAFPKRQQLSDTEVVKDSLAEICVSNSAFIKVPEPDESRLEIWGTPEQVVQAQRELSLWEAYWKGPGKGASKVNRFSKLGAYDGRAVERSARKQIQEHEHDAYQIYADDSMLPFEAHLVWPEGYDLESFILTYNKDVLDPLRKKYRCRINPEEGDLREIVVSADNQVNLMQVYTRLLGLLKELVTKKRQGVRATQCRLPDAHNFRDQVSLRDFQFQDSTERIPELCGEPLPSQEIEQWTELTTRADRQYRKTTKEALRSCIRSLYVSQKHVRMRVSFGTIALHKYKLPTNNSKTYSIDDDFIAMTTEPQLVIKQCPITKGSSFDFLDRIQTMPEFGNMSSLSWVLHFDFVGEQNTVLRLEKEFSENLADPQEPSVAATRWVYHNEGATTEVEGLLELSHMVIGEVGYQVNIGALAMYNNEKVTQDLRDFEGKIDFRPSLEGQRFQPAKHVSFVKHPSLKKVVENTIARYNFKKTGGTLEIRRRDCFEKSSGFGATPDWTEWRATYYYAEWDSLTGEFANIEPGEDVTWRRDLSTFFPKVTDEDNPKLLPSGYREFMKEVEEIRGLLTQATEGVPGSTIPEKKGKGKALRETFR